MKPGSPSRYSTSAALVIWMMLAIYLLFSVGIVKATHFCMGREASVSYFTGDAKKCPCALFAAEKADCCEDEQGLLKIENSQKTLPAFALSLPSFTLLGEVYDVLSQSAGEKLTAFASFMPDVRPPARVLFKLHCSYVFYDDDLIA